MTRAHLVEQGIIAPTGPAHVGCLAATADRDNGVLPTTVRDLARMLLEQIADLREKVEGLDEDLRRRHYTAAGDNPKHESDHRSDDHDLCAADGDIYKSRDCAVWVDRTPRQHSSGGKKRLERTSKMGQKDIRRLLIIGAVAVLRWAAHKGAPEGSWRARILARKPKMLVAVALANRMARTAWTPIRKSEYYRDPGMTTA